MGNRTKVEMRKLKPNTTIVPMANPLKFCCVASTYDVMKTVTPAHTLYSTTALRV